MVGQTIPGDKWQRWHFAIPVMHVPLVQAFSDGGGCPLNKHDAIKTLTDTPTWYDLILQKICSSKVEGRKEVRQKAGRLDRTSVEVVYAQETM